MRQKVVAEAIQGHHDDRIFIWFKALQGCLSGLQRILVIFLCLISSAHAAEREVTLQWDESIDAPYLQSYVLYYYTESGNPASLSTADYADAYKLAGGNPVLIDSADPRPVTIDKSNTQITFYFSDIRKNYYFVVTAVDTAGLESVPSNEVLFEKGSDGGDTGGPGGGGGCFIATAAFGSFLNPHVQGLKEFRNRYLLTNSPGRAFVTFYNRYSPPVAEKIRQHAVLKAAARWALVPVVLCLQYPYILLVFFIIPAGIAMMRSRSRKNGNRRGAV